MCGMLQGSGGKKSDVAREKILPSQEAWFSRLRRRPPPCVPPLLSSFCPPPLVKIGDQAAAMWQQLGSVALEEGDINIAERCAAALGDVSRARFLHKVGGAGERCRERDTGNLMVFRSGAVVHFAHDRPLHA